MFSHNAANVPELKTPRMFRRVRQVAPHAKLLSTIAGFFDEINVMQSDA